MNGIVQFLVWFVILLLFLFVLVIYFQPNWAVTALFARRYPSVFWFTKTKHNVCSLTIDDAPSASTSEILDILKIHNVKATFFIISDQIQGHERVMERLVTEGHTLGNHLTRDEASIKLTDKDFELNLLECDTAISQYQSPNMGTKKWMRPGCGFLNQKMLRTCEKHDYHVCMGNCYPHDCQIKSTAINSRYYQQRTRPGSIVIIHDRPWNIPTLKLMLPILTKQIHFVSLEELQSYNTSTNLQNVDD